MPVAETVDTPVLTPTPERPPVETALTSDNPMEDASAAKLEIAVEIARDKPEESPMETELAEPITEDVATPALAAIIPAEASAMPVPVAVP